MPLLRTHSSLKALILGAGLCVILPVMRADDSAKPPEVSDKTAQKIEELVRPNIVASDWKKTVEALNAILAQVKPGSYDEVYLDQMKGQYCLQDNDYKGALEALERMLELSDEHPEYIPEKTRHSGFLIVAELNFQEGSTSKDPKVKADYYAKAERDADQWLQQATTFTPQNLYFISVMYYTLAQEAMQSPEPAEKAKNASLMEKAEHWTDKGLRSAARPLDIFYQLKLAELLQRNSSQEATEYLELLLQKKPTNKNYWQQLAAMYLQLSATATEHHNEQEAFENTVRTIITIERAQKYGLMDTPQDNYNLVKLYFQAGQYPKACEMLSQGLEDGSIEATQQNYEFLAYSYQEFHRDFKAILTLEKAARLFPKSGEIEYQIALIYYQLEKLPEALTHIKSCIAKGGTPKPNTGWMFYGTIAYELKKYDEALTAAQHAAKYPEAKAQALQLEAAVKASLQDRESRHKAQQVL